MKRILSILLSAILLTGNFGYAIIGLLGTVNRAFWLDNSDNTPRPGAC